MAGESIANEILSILKSSPNVGYLIPSLIELQGKLPIGPIVDWLLTGKYENGILWYFCYSPSKEKIDDILCNIFSILRESSFSITKVIDLIANRLIDEISQRSDVDNIISWAKLMRVLRKISSDYFYDRTFADGLSEWLLSGEYPPRSIYTDIMLSMITANEIIDKFYLVTKYEIIAKLIRLCGIVDIPVRTTEVDCLLERVPDVQKLEPYLFEILTFLNSIREKPDAPEPPTIK